MSRPSFLSARRLCGLMLAAAIAMPGQAQSLDDATRAAVLAQTAKTEAGLAEDALAIWRFAEVGYQEHRSTAQLQARLRKNGFKVEAGVAGMPTAFVASFKTGDGPVIGFIAEFDALPGLAQEAVAERKPIAGQAAGHGCGHNVFGAASVASAIAVSKWMREKGIKGEVRVFGAPAEEGGAGKVYMVRAGLFADVDTVLHFHPDDYNAASQIRSLANVSGKFRFHGVAAHAAGAPERGISALDGVQVMNIAVEHLREHVPDGTRIHYVITDGGKAPNVVPDFAEVYYYVRHADPEVVRTVWARVKKAAEGAAIATGTTSDLEVVHGAYPMMPNRTLMAVVDASMRAAPITPWTVEEKAFAAKLSETLAKKKPLDQNVIEPAKFGELLFGSTDVADISWTVPTAGFEAMTWVPGTPGHSWQSAATSGMGIGIKGGELASRTMALSAANLFLNPDIMARAKAELVEARGKDFVYQSMVGDRSPPLDYRMKTER